MTKLSIIIPIYNGESFIERCLESIICQNNGKIEVYLIDDGSIDNTAKICANYTSKYSYIYYFYKQNGGVSSARNLGLEKITGDFVWFVDIDDEITDNAINEVFLSQGADLTICNFYKVNQQKKLIDLKNEEGILQIEDLNKFFTNYVFTYKLANGPLNKIYKTELIKKHKLSFDEHLKIGEDYTFNLLYYKHIKKVEFKKAPIYLYYHTEGSAMNSKNTEVFSYRHQIAQIIKNEYKNILNSLILEQFLLMTLVSAIRLSNERGVDNKQIRESIRKYMKDIMEGNRFSYITVNNFLSSEGVGILSKIKFKLRFARLIGSDKR